MMTINKQKIKKIKEDIVLFLRVDRLPALSVIVFSSVCALIGFSTLFTLNYSNVDFYENLFLIQGVLFLFTGIYAFKKNKTKSLRVFFFALIIFFMVYLSNTMFSTIDLEEYGFNALVYHEFFLVFFLIVFGLAGTALGFAALLNFKSLGREYGAHFILLVAIILILFILYSIVSTVFFEGLPGISWEFLTTDLYHMGLYGGVFSGIVGTFFLMLIIFFVAVPLGVGAAIYLEEYAGGSFIVRIIKVSVSILRGVPSIVFGLFGLAFFVPIFGASFLSGGLILSSYALPMIIRTASESIKSVPQGLREGSLALGATKSQTIRRVVLPPSLPGVVTGVVLGLGEAAGETAPIMFMSTIMPITGMNPFELLGQSIRALPVHIYQLFRLKGYGGTVESAARLQNGWSAALVLLSMFLIINVIALIIREKYREEF